MDSSTAVSTSPRFTVAQQLQNLAASNTSALLQSVGIKKPNLYGVETNSNFATKSMLMHAVSSELTPLLASPELLGRVIDYRINEKAQRNNDQSPDETKTDPNPTSATSRDAALRAKYLALFPGFANQSGNTLNTAV